MNKIKNMKGGACEINNIIPNKLAQVVGIGNEGLDKSSHVFKFIAEWVLFISIFPLIPIFYILAIGLSALKYMLLKFSTL